MIKRLRRRILGGTAWCWEPACDLLEPAEDCLSGWEEASRWARWLYESGEAIDAVPLGGRGPPYVRSKAVGTSGALESADGGRSIVYKAKKDPKLLLQARRGLRPLSRGGRREGSARAGAFDVAVRACASEFRRCRADAAAHRCVWTAEAWRASRRRARTKPREQGFMHVMMEAGRAESDCKTRQQRATPHPCARAWRCEGLRPLPLPCWAGTPRALPVTARRPVAGSAKNTCLPPSAAPEGPTTARQRRQCQVCASNDAQIAGVSTVPVKICRAGRSWVRFTSCAALLAASYSRWLG